MCPHNVQTLSQIQESLEEVKTLIRYLEFLLLL